jgi:hypothetical protein
VLWQPRHMQHFPSISEDEFRIACQIFDERASTTGAPDKNASFQCAYASGTLSIKKEYLIGAPHDLYEEATETAPSDDDGDELTDDEDPEVRVQNISCFKPDWGHKDN